jgi:hypothetical protein
MFYIIVILAPIFAIPANALDGISPPAVVPPPIVVPPGRHNPDLQRAAKELLEQAAQLRRGGTELLAQASPSGASLKDQLVGTWTLVSCANPSLAFCAGNNGIHMLDASGHYTWIIAARGRPKVTAPNAAGGANRDAFTPEQYKSIAAGLFAQFGTWSVNEANKTVTFHVDGALFPFIEGTEVTLPVSISGDELRLGQPQPNVWRRIK